MSNTPEENLKERLNYTMKNLVGSFKNLENSIASRIVEEKKKTIEQDDLFTEVKSDIYTLSKDKERLLAEIENKNTRIQNLKQRTEIFIKKLTDKLAEIEHINN